MTTRETSRIAYRELVSSGQLKGRQADILALVIENGPGTAAEILKGSPQDKNRNLARARFTELQARGLIIEAGMRECVVTGRRALVWEFSGRTKALDGERSRSASRRELAAMLVRLCDATAGAWPNRHEIAREARALAARA